MGVNSLPKTVTRQRRGCDLNPGPSAPEFSTLTTGYRATPLPDTPLPGVHPCVQYNCGLTVRNKRICYVMLCYD